MMEKRAYILLALLALLLLSGCAAQTQKREPVLALQCTHPTSLSAIRPAGDGAVAVCWEDYENLRTTIQLVDTAYDTVRKEVTLEGIRTMLEAMGRAFALYPEDFLAQFRNEAGEGGLCFLPVAHIGSDYGVVGRLSKKPVIASQSADWRGNPFSKHMIFAL